VLFELDMIINEFVYAITAKLTKSEQLARNTSAKLFTYGSYRLGAHTDESDIDTLCVCPQHITQKIFFHSLPPILKKHEGVQELTVTETRDIGQASKCDLSQLIYHWILDCDFSICTCNQNDFPWNSCKELYLSGYVVELTFI